MSRGPAIVLNQAPAPCRPPIVFEPPQVLARGTALWVVTTGPREDWGGAYVAWSEDGDEYHPVHPPIGPKAVCGTLLDPLPGSHWPVHRLTDSVRVALDDEGVLAAKDEDAARRLQTLCYLGDWQGAYELVAFSGARLLERTDDGAHVYALSGLLWRGAYGTTVRAHPIGTRFARLDDSVAKIALEDRLIGWPLYLKVMSLNAVGDMDSLEDPADAEPITVTLAGGACPV